MVQRDEQRAWVRGVLTHLRMKPTELARAIHRAPSTLNRFLNDPEIDHDLGRETVERIAALAKVAPYELPRGSGSRRAGVLREPEAEPYEGGDQAVDKSVDDALRSFMRTRNTVAGFVLRSTALVGASYLPGDLLVVDLNERPKPQDVVCAQVYDWGRDNAETIFRIYEPPYLLASTPEARLARPLVVDDDTVVVKGVVLWSLRPRRPAEIAA